MADRLSLARPYAKAFFEIAVEANALSAWDAFLQGLVMLVTNEDFQYLLMMPDRDNEKLYALVSDIMRLDDKTYQQAVRVLLGARRFFLAEEILTIYQAYKAEHEKTMNVHITASMPMSDQDVSSLKAALEKRFNQTVTVDVSSDENLLGGAIIRIDDFVIDGSGRQQLESLKQYLKGNQLCS